MGIFIKTYITNLIDIDYSTIPNHLPIFGVSILESPFWRPRLFEYTEWTNRIFQRRSKGEEGSCKDRIRYSFRI